MNSSSVIKNISIIVAYRNSGRHLLDMFIDLTDYGYDEYVKVECSAELDNEFANESI